jgi:alcohol-forming fatty acyl-CoA reductase
MDFVAFILGKKMIYRRAYKKTENVLLLMSFFGLREWNVSNRNVQMLAEKTKNFPNRLEFELRNVNWREYFKAYIPGIKRYYFKENVNKSKQIADRYQW